MAKLLLVLLAAVASSGAIAQGNRIDVVRHDAPELAHRGDHDIGVRTVEFTDPNRPDILNSPVDGEPVYYSRSLTVEVWYPAVLDDDHPAGTDYVTTTRNPSISATLHGRAARGARARADNGPFPLVIISHGYPGNRYLMSHLGENLASKGYVVASIDHRDSTYEDQQAFWSTLYNRPLDQIFVLDQMAALSTSADSFLYGRVDTDNTAIVGYSMGGYGLVVNLGGGYSDYLVSHDTAPNPTLALRHAASNPDFRQPADARIKAGFAVAPWGMADRVWEKTDLQNIDIPLFFLTGSLDETAGYELGTRALYESVTQSDRYLLTFVNAGHNAIAPIPLPIEILDSEDQTGASHYTDAVWDSVRSSNVMMHFATAFFDLHLKGRKDRLAYLELLPNAQDGVFSMQEDQPTAAHSYWKGFPRYTARGLLLEHLEPEE